MRVRFNGANEWKTHLNAYDCTLKVILCQWMQMTGACTVEQKCVTTDINVGNVAPSYNNKSAGKGCYNEAVNLKTKIRLNIFLSDI